MTARRKKEWFDDDAFWVETYPFMFPKKRFTDAIDQIDKILELVNLRGKAVLDLCCGPGRCSIALAKKGFHVTGVDKTEFLLKKAKARARTAKAKIEWIQCDMRDFVRQEAFDLALNMFTSFGFFDDKEDDSIVLGNVFASLRPGGVFLIDAMGKERLASILQPTTSDQLPNGTTLVQRHEIFDNWTRIRNEWVLIRNGRAKVFRFHHTIYSGQELIDRMQRVGFVDVELYGNLDGDEYGPDATRLICVGHKS